MDAVDDYLDAGYDITKTIERPRYLGARTTRVVGGLLLHTTRK